MPYTPWDETQPLGSADSDNIDEFFRALKVQIRERMNDILAEDGQWDDDPIRLKSDETTTTNRTVMYPPHLIEINPNGSTGVIQSRTPSYVRVDGTGIVPVPVFGLKGIQKIEIAIDCESHVIDWTLHNTLFSDPPTTNGFTFNTITGGFQIVDLLDFTAVDFPVNDTVQYALTIASAFPLAGNYFKYYGMRITYSGEL